MAKGWVVQTAPAPNGNYNRIVTEINDGDYIVVKGVDFKTEAKKFNASASCVGKGCTIEVRLESEKGILLCSIPVSDTGGWNTFKTFSASTIEQGDVADLYFIFKSKSKSNSKSELCRLDWWSFE